jgi:hypothetical protein
MLSLKIYSLSDFSRDQYLVSTVFKRSQQSVLMAKKDIVAEHKVTRAE